MKIKKNENYNLLANIFMYASMFIFALISILFLTKNNIILFLIAFLVLIFISLKSNIKKFPLLLFIVSFFIRLAAILILDFPQVSDAETLLKASNLFAKGDYSFQNLQYFKLWGYQTGFVVYQGLILKIFSNPIILKILNALYSSTLVLLIYVFGKKISSERSARMASLLYMIFPFPIYMNSIMINHHISTFLTYIGIFFLLKKERKIKDYAIAALLISIGNIMRPEAIIVIFSLFLFELFRLKKNTIIEVLKRVGVFILIYFLIGTLSGFIIQKADINNEGLKNNNPLWKFVLGFNHESCGYYDSKDEPYLLSEEKEIEIIKDRVLVNPVKMTRLLACKVNRFWLQSNITSKNDMYATKTFNVLGVNIKFTDLENIVIKFNNVLYLVTFFTCIIGIMFNHKKILKSDSFYFLILMIVTFFVYLLIEIQPRYAYFIHITIFILSAYGFDYILEKAKKIITKKKRLLVKLKSRIFRLNAGL